MIKIIFNQIWNQRRMNGWIFIELLAVSFFLWVVLDPVCVLTATKNIAPGYEKEKVNCGCHFNKNSLQVFFQYFHEQQKIFHQVLSYHPRWPSCEEQPCERSYPKLHAYS